MAKRLTVNIGFITNSSSCVYYFPKEILDDPEVKAFIEANGLGSGYVSDDLWSRSACASFAVTQDQKLELKQGLSSYYGDTDISANIPIDVNDNGAYVVYGDEYEDTTQVLCKVLGAAMARLRGSDKILGGYLGDYN